MKKYQNQRILVLGLGKTGQSVLNFFKNQKVILSSYAENISDVDRSYLAQTFPHTFFYSGALREVLLNHYFDWLVLSPGFSLYRPEIQSYLQAGGQVTSDIQLWLEQLKKPTEKLIAITGSNGKSTVTELVGFLCQRSGLKTMIAGNIGLPVLDAVQNTQEVIDVWVLELSSFQLEAIDNLAADAATCLNISEDHLDRYRNLLDYAYHKDKIFTGAKIQVLNLDDPLCCAMQRKNLKTIWFSLKQVSDYWFNQKNNHLFLMKGDEYLISMNHVKLQGVNNAANILVSLALCESIGLDTKKLLDILPFFKGLPHRVEKIGEIDSISFIDDSKGTNVGATKAALEGAPGKVVLIAGGLAKGQNFAPLKKIIEEKVKGLFLIGQDASKIAEIFQDSTIHPIMCCSLEEATRAAFKAAPRNSWVLLSPACASMDMFKDYQHRAQVFMQTYEELKNESTK